MNLHINFITSSNVLQFKNIFIGPRGIKGLIHDQAKVYPSKI
jgi:hypothetical protein